MALKTFKPITPGQRQLVLVDREPFVEGQAGQGADRGPQQVRRPQQSGPCLDRGIAAAGISATTAWSISSGGKFGMPATVERLEYDPNRTAFIALIKYEDGELAYILAPQRLAAGDKVIADKRVDVKPGNAMPLANMPIGTIVHNVEMKQGKGGQIARARPELMPSSSAATPAMPSCG